jgi:dephospho-CoA kinase
MLKLVKIAITGGVASGKTSVCQFFQQLGAFVVNTDKIVHELLLSDTDLVQKIIRQFGPEVVTNGELNRRAIAEKVFKDSKSLQVLEKLVHPAVLRKIEQFYVRAAEKKSYSSFVVEIPLLFEIQGESVYDYIVTVVADEAIAKKRFQAQGFQNIEYDQRMKRQLSPHQKTIRSHYTLQNNGSLADLENKVIALNQILQQTKE